MRELLGAVGPEDVEEPGDGRGVAARLRPDQVPRIVVDHHGQVLLALAVADLVDPDPGQPREPVGDRVHVGTDPFHDRPDGAPGDPHQLRDRGLRRLRGQPRHLVIEHAGMPGVVPGPRDLSDHHSVLGAGHPHRIGLHEDPDRAQIQPPPPARLTATLVVAPAPATTAPAPATLPRHRPHRHDHDLLVLVEHDVLDDRLLDPQNRTP
jgi:hypothetical protein